MAAQASSGAEGLHAVSSALLNQAKAQASASAQTFQDAAADPRSTPMARNWSDSVGYSAAMSRHIASTIQHQMSQRNLLTAGPVYGTHQHRHRSISYLTRFRRSRSTDGSHRCSSGCPRSSASMAHSVALRRSSVQTDATASATLAAASQSSSTSAVASDSDTRASHRRSLRSFSSNEPNAEPRPPNGSDSTDMSVTEYLRYLGLNHIEMPSEGIEQSFGRDRTSSSRYWDATNPHMGFSLSGVPVCL